ncbi:queuosine precursor transporter [Adhaeribacter aquaticus]|uniref:queuosine precursor transporter n=1 Tax=Adhaeribacter aquaticus TaxID=299567 RepID=UPI0003FFD0C3|nr:queuosine precursor transporter [Adhaeribacter aquaticus]
MDSPFQRKKTLLFLILSSIFLTNAVLAELIGVKIFSGEASLGLPPAHLNLFADTPFDFNLTAGVIIWPVVFITTDIINEYFGKEGVKKISIITVCLILYTFLVITVITNLPPAAFWLDVNSKTPDGKPFDIDYAFNSIYRQGGGIIIGSVCAFLLGQLLDASVFHWLRQLTGKKKIWLRATGSTLVSQLVDTVVVLFVAFYVFGNWTLTMVFSVSIINYLYKFFVAIIMTPILYVAHAIIDKYLGINQANQLVTEAAQDRSIVS